MKKYPHLVSQLFNRPLLITREKHAAICRILDARLGGQPAAAYDDSESESAAGPEIININGTGIIPVHGVLGKHLDLFEMASGGCDCDTVAAMVDTAAADTNIDQIIFDFRSPGGSVTGIPELGRKIAGLKKNTIAFTDSQCCSGALWLAEQCRAFHATESSCIGSIGVWCAYWDLTKAMEMDGERMQCISAGKYKTMGAYWQPLTPEELQILQEDVDKIHEQFKDAVILRREIKDEFMQGQTFDGTEALAAGLIDGLVEEMDELF